MDSEKFVQKKKSNMPLLLGIGGGGLLLLIVIIAAASGGGDRPVRPRHPRNPPTSRKPRTAPAAPASRPERPLSPEERSVLKEAFEKENAARAIVEKYFEKRGGSYTLKPEFQNAKAEVSAEIERAHRLMADMVSIMERLSAKTGQNYMGKDTTRFIKSVNMLRRGFAH